MPTLDPGLMLDMAAGLMLGGSILTAIVLLTREAAMAHRGC